MRAFLAWLFAPARLPQTEEEDREAAEWQAFQP